MKTKGDKLIIIGGLELRQSTAIYRKNNERASKRGI